MTGGTFDLNELINTGFYYCFNASTNMPRTVGGGLIVIRYSAAAVQIFVENNSSGGLYVRGVLNATSSEPTWTAWRSM